MNPSQTPEDIENAEATEDYSDEDTLAEREEYLIEYDIDAAQEKEEVKEVEAIDVSTRKKRSDNESEETLITPEDKIAVSEEASTESSDLSEVEIGDFQLRISNLYTKYPVPDDPGLTAAFGLLHEPPPVYKDDGVQKYRDAMRRAGLRPIASLGDMLLTDEVNLRYYGLESRAMGPICEALTDNPYVQKVDLKDNVLSAAACEHLNELLQKNKTIISLSLAGCRIGANGAKQLCDAISTSTTLKELDLSSCDIGSDGFEQIAYALCTGQSIEKINLSDNRLDESCAESLRDLVTRADEIVHLDLSRNSLRSAKTWKALTNRVGENDTLRSLNLSWNGLGTECVPYLCQLLSQWRSIEKLDLSWNGFTGSDAPRIAASLTKNSTLQELYLGNNPLKARGASAIVHAATSPDNALHILNLENVWANKDIFHDLETLKELRPQTVVTLGGILSNYQLTGPDARKILLKRANYTAMLPKKKKQQRDFGHFVLSLKDRAIPQSKFVKLVKRFKLKLPTTLVEEIMNVFKGPKNTVDQGLLKTFYLKEYPETSAPPQKEKDKTAKKKQKKK